MAGADDIIDMQHAKSQEELNAENDGKFSNIDETLAEHDISIKDRYTKEQVNNIVSRTPETDVIVVAVPEGAAIATYLEENIPNIIDPDTGKSSRANKLYRVPGPGNTTYSEWAYDGENWVMLDNKNYGVDDTPKDGSLNLITSDAVAQSRKVLHPKNSTVDLSFQDEDGNAIMDLNDGHIKTKKFDSCEVTNKVHNPDTYVRDGSSKFSIADEGGNDAIIIDHGHVETKNFNSANTPKTGEGADNESLSISDESGNNVVEFKGGHVNTKHFDSNKSISYGEGEGDTPLSVCDQKGNNIVEFSKGHIKTKEFDSKDMLAVKGLVSDIDRIQNWIITGGIYTHGEYDYTMFNGGFEVTKNVSSAPGHNRAIDLSNDILPGKVIFEYSYNGTNNIPVYDSKNAGLIYWGTDVTDANIIGTIKPGTGTLEVEIVHNDRKYVGIYCNDLQIGTTLRITNTHAQVKASSSQNDPIYTPVYSSKINEISDAYYNLGEAGRIGYVFITDLHFNSNINNNKALLRQLQAVVDIANNCQIDFVCVGGDVVDGTTASASKELVISYVRQMMNILSGCKCPVVILAGNHDDNCYHSSGYGNTDKGFYARNMLVDNAIIPQMIIGGSEADDCYYYFDIEKKNLRVICLDYIDYNKNADKSGRSWWGFSKEQVTWFCNTALNTNKDIIVLSHGQIVDIRYGFYNLEDEGDKDWSGSVSNKINNSVPAPSGYVHAYYSGYTTDIKNVISAFNAKSSITLYGNTYDFSTRNGNIILSHHGHFHGDFELNIGNMPVILTGCAKNEPGDTYYADYKVAGKEDTYMFPDLASAESQHANGYGYEFVDPNNRDFGTINEALFDIVSVNSTAINILRVGAGKDRVINR